MEEDESEEEEISSRRASGMKKRSTIDSDDSETEFSDSPVDPETKSKRSKHSHGTSADNGAENSDTGETSLVDAEYDSA